MTRVKRLSHRTPNRSLEVKQWRNGRKDQAA
jgi:hypothetical protein